MISTRSKIFTACAAAIAALGLSTAQAFELVDLDGEPKIITVDDPNDPKYANAGDNLRNGVGSIFVEFVESDPFGFLCTASAIGPRHILTAAHCVYEFDPSVDAAPWTVDRIRFVLSAGMDSPVIIEGTAFAFPDFYPLFNFFYGAFAHQDIAVIELAEDLPAGIETYGLYSGMDEFGQDTRHYGHGTSGKGNKGGTGGSDFFYARTGLNQYEQVLEPFLGDGIEDQLLHDFDSGGSKHNAMAWWFSTAYQCGPDNANPPWAQDGQCTTFKDGNYPDFKGYGKFEIGIGPGDSGGPGFIGDEIAGVHSFGFTHFCSGVTNGTDFTCGLDSSYGEMSGDTRVSYYADWVADVMDGTVVPTPIGILPETVDASAAAEVVGPAGKLFLDNTYSATMRQRVKFSDIVED